MNQTLEIAHQAVKLYAESHPRPVHVTQRQAAEMLHLSPPTVSKLVKSGKLKLNGAGLIPISQIDELLLADVQR
jgi:predicted XRE-type DNA-binding protein